MKRNFIIGIGIVGVVAVMAGLWSLASFFNVRVSTTVPGVDFLKTPEGFYVTIFAENFGESTLSLPGPNAGPRMMAVKNDTAVLVTMPRQGKVFALEDRNG